MNKIEIAGLCAAVLALAACGRNRQLEAARTFEKEACACKDAACANAAASRFAEQTKKMAAAPKNGADGTAYSTSVQNATNCVAKLSMPTIPNMPTLPAIPGAPPAR